MARTTGRAQSIDDFDAGAQPARGRVSRRGRHAHIRSLLAVLTLALLGCALSSASAWAVNTAPKVVKQPGNRTVEEGQSAVFEATASGSPTPTVQWEVSTNGGSTFTPIAGATSDQLTIADAKLSQSGDQYRAVFTNVVGQATSKVGTLTVQLAPVITLQPVGVAVEENQNATFEAAAVGVPTPTVQWEVSFDGGVTFTKILNATSDKFTFANVKPADSGKEYRATFTNAAGTVSSRAAKLTVQNIPKLTKQPLSLTVDEGQSASFEATASGLPAPTVQWEVSTNAGSTFTPIEGATANKLTIASAKLAENGDEFRAVFSNAAGTATSSVATLTVHQPPVVTQQPIGTTVEVGQSATFEAAATGFPTPTVQWEVSTNGGSKFTPVPGATADVLTVTDAKAAENGNEYRAVFTNVAGKATSEAATLTVAIHHFRALAWGQGSAGQLGDGGILSKDLPVPVKGLNFVTAVAAGRRHGLVLLANGTVMAWGENASGELGDGEPGGSDVPVAVTGLTRVEAIAAGENYSLALLSNGTVMAWGGNESGQLGDGSTEASDVPVPVSGLTGVIAIAAGGEHSLALLSNGTVMAWGNNEHGQLGDGGEANREAPVAVKGLTGVTAIAAGGEHSLALLNKGTVMAWGDDQFGQLGHVVAEAGEPEEEGEVVGTEEDRHSDAPVAVSGVSGATAVAAGAHDSLALLAGGTVMAWGEDEFGELGDGSIARGQETPVAVSGLSGATAIAAGGEHSMALLSNGTVATWGEDKFGELGDGSAGEPSDVPVAVSGLGEVVGIAAGGGFDLAVGEPLPEVTRVAPDEGPLGGGISVTITGSDFTGASAVHFGSNSATSFTVRSPGSITAVAPAGTLGTVNVTVTTSAGTSPAEAADRFSYVAAPVVKKLSEKGGTGAGGTTVTITGTNFEHASAVHFGMSSAASFVVESATSIKAVSPAGAGVVNVTVTTPGGTSATTKVDEFKYTPAVDSIEAASGPVAGGTTVTITGDGFAVGAGATSFKFGTKVASGVECGSTSTCTAIVPAGKAGTVTVVATVGKAKSAANPPGDEFTYE